MGSDRLVTVTLHDTLTANSVMIQCVYCAIRTPLAGSLRCVHVAMGNVQQRRTALTCSFVCFQERWLVTDYQVRETFSIGQSRDNHPRWWRLRRQWLQLTPRQAQVSRWDVTDGRAVAQRAEGASRRHTDADSRGADLRTVQPPISRPQDVAVLVVGLRRGQRLFVPLHPRYIPHNVL